jgi:diguanylate cyclase (GGDEF)-like protein/PAS domain S-box-containing protein
VRWMPALMSGRPRIPWQRRHRFAIRVVGCSLLIAVATVYIRYLPWGNHLIWLANGVLLAYLLTTPRRRWAAFLGASFVVQTVADLLVESQWQLNLMRTMLNLAEVLIGAHLLRRGSTQWPRFTDRTFLLRFIAFGVLAGPLAIGSVYGPIAAFWLHDPLLRSMLQWTVADALGAGVATPACVAILRIRFRAKLDSKKHLVYLFLLFAATLAAFSQTKIPLVFFIYPLLLLVLLRLGLGWAAMATLFVAAVGSWFTIRNEGPFALSTSLSPLEPTFLLQVFIAAGIFMIYTVSVVLESQHAIERRLQKIVAQHALVTENSRDAIILSDFNGNRRFVSAAAQHMGGWTPQEVMNQKSTELIRPDDLPKAAAVVRQLNSGAEDAMIAARVRKRNGEYLWVESSLRVVRDPVTGAPTGILNMVRDITERKQAEQKLQEAYRAVETLAITDALTGLANRRQFDQCLTTEWRRGLRDRNPLAMLLIDVDLFKSYNDTYGHVRGDSCLKQIAEAALDAAARPGDLVARFGGEEFAVILPNTDSEGALQVANEICDGLRRRSLEHSTNPLGILTISVGCAAMVPSLGQHAIHLIELADEALYTAKRNGRSQVCTCNAMASSGSLSPAADLSELFIAKTA